MQSNTTDSLDISSLVNNLVGDTQVRGNVRPRLRSLSQPTLIAQSQPPRQGSLRSAIALQHALSQPNGDHQPRMSEQHSLMPDDDSGLPSTVPESLDAQAPLRPQAFTPRANASAVRMNSQSGEDATQEISQEYYKRHIEQSRSRIALANDETQYTLMEGDEGHIDLVSSFKGRDETEEESEPVDIPSPTQDRSQSHQPFAESQRFKTPATAGKKRTYNGNTKETPILPRAPLLRSGGGTPGMLLDLSQAFADTQAQTSPFVHGTLNPRSDRPSPRIDFGQRPATAPESSPPLERISGVKHKSAEPATHYRSVDESQDERDRRTAEELGSEEDSDADSWEKPGPAMKQFQRRMQQETEKEAQAQEVIFLDHPSVKRARKDHGDPNPITITEDDDSPESEAETEQEDERALVQRSSQRQIDPEDKENLDSAIQIPQTTARPSRTISEPLNGVQVSPSVRPNHQLSSSAGPLVPNTQISQSASQRTQLKSSSTSGLDFVPQSQNIAEEQIRPRILTRSTLRGSAVNAQAPGDDELSDPQEPLESDHEVHEDALDEDDVDDLSQDDVASVDENEGDTQEAPQGGEEQHQEKDTSRRKLAPKPSTMPLLREQTSIQHTVPETVSVHSIAQQTIHATETNPSNAIASNFETAPSRIPPSDDQHSRSSPSSTPRLKRKRSEVWNQESPIQEGWSQTFNPVSALQDPHDMNLIDEDESPRPLEKRRRTKPFALAVNKTASPEKAGAALKNSGTGIDTVDELLASQPDVRSKHRGTNTRPGRASVFDIGVTPSPQKKAPLVKHSARSLRSHAGTQKRERSPQKSKDIAPKDDSSDASSQQRPMQTQTPEKTPQKEKSPRENKRQARQPSVESRSTAERPIETDHLTRAGDVIAPNAVFACFNGKTRAYYPAWCIGKGSDDHHYMVQWDGYEPDEIDIFGIRNLDLRMGDQVKVDMTGVPKVSHIIRGFKDKVQREALKETLTDQRGFKTVLIAPKQRKSLPADVSTENVREVPISAIYLDSNMWAQMKARTYAYRTPLRSIDASGYATPDEQSTPSTSQSRHRRQTGVPASTAVLPANGLLKGMVFAISSEDSDRRRELDNLIWSNGGYIVGDEGFAELFESDEMTLKAKYASSGFTALLADKHSRKPKYLQALGLGLPCLSGKWIEECISKHQVVDWQPYLLPAGECDKLDGATKSRIMRHLPADKTDLEAQLEARERVLDGEKVAVIVGRGKAEARMNNYLFFLRAMGVDVLDKVADTKAARELLDDDDGYGLIYVERDVEAVEAALRAGKAAKKSGIGKGKPKTKEKGQWVVCETESIVQSLIFGSRID
jgi:hypothetical protein